MLECQFRCTVTSAAAPIHAIPRFGLTEYLLGFVVLILKVVLAPTATMRSFCTVAVLSAKGKRSSAGSMRMLMTNPRESTDGGLLGWGFRGVARVARRRRKEKKKRRVRGGGSPPGLAALRTGTAAIPKKIVRQKKHSG